MSEKFDNSEKIRPADSGSTEVKSLSDVGKAAISGQPPDETLYTRPTHYRTGVKEEVWEQAKDSKGIVHDLVSKKTIKFNDDWEMGHKPGYEFRKHQKSATERGITREEFLDEHNNPEHYRPELPSSNRSHKGEDMTDEYFGP